MGVSPSLTSVLSRIKLSGSRIFCEMVQKRTTPPQSRPRGRPREYDSDRALADAAESFWKNGYAATSLDELAAATGMNRPSLYAAFGDKRDLYLKTLKRYRDQSRSMVMQILSDNPTLRVFLTRFYKTALDIYLAGEDGARGCYSIATAGVRATVDPSVRAFLADSVRSTDALLAGLVRKAQDRGE